MSDDIFDVDSNASEIADWIRDVYHEQVPYATAVAINDTAKDFQAEQRRHMHQVFEVRRPQFVDRAVKINPFATKRRREARVLVEPPGGQARADVISKFEEGGTKKPRSGERLAIPEDVQRSASGIIPRSKRIGAFNFRAHGGKVFSTKSNVLIGDKRTIMIRRPGGRGAVLQRKGRGKGSELKVLYVFRPNVKIEDNLNFRDNAAAVVRKRFEVNFDRAFVKAMRSAK